MKTILEFDGSKEDYCKDQMMQAIKAGEAFHLIWCLQSEMRNALEQESPNFGITVEKCLEAIYDSHLMEYYN